MTEHQTKNERIDALEWIANNQGARVGILSDKVDALDRDLDLLEERMYQLRDKTDRNVTAILTRLTAISAWQEGIDEYVGGLPAVFQRIWDKLNEHDNSRFPESTPDVPLSATGPGMTASAVFTGTRIGRGLRFQAVSDIKAGDYFWMELGDA